MTAAAPVSTLWTIDAAHTEAAFAVKHMMISTVRGRFSDVQGQVSFDPAALSTGSVSVTVNVASVDTREAQRDAHLRSADFFDVEKFPVLTFKSRRVQGVKGDAFQLVGDRPIRGVANAPASARGPRSTERTSASAGTSCSRPAESSWART